MKLPKISVVTITYGHELYILDCIKGVLSQQYNGEIEFIITNDNSPDNTDQKVNDFLKSTMVPNNITIKYIRHNVNKGMVSNFSWTLEQCTGKYIAICEGDDYWIDYNKLQKQIDILENNSDISICMTHVKYFYDGTDKLLDFNTLIDKNKTSVYTLKEYLRFRFSHTSTFVFRKIAYNNNLLQGFFGADQAMVINIALSGNIYYLNDLTSLYRISGSNITSATKKNIWINSTIEFYESVNKITNYKYSKLIKFHILYYKILKKIHIVFIELVWSKIYFISLKFFK